MKIAKYFIITTAMIASGAQAAEESPFVEAARLRQYVGGRDESDLKVQPSLNQNTKKKNNTSAGESAE